MCAPKCNDLKQYSVCVCVCWQIMQMLKTEFLNDRTEFTNNFDETFSLEFSHFWEHQAYIRCATAYTQRQYLFANCKCLFRLRGVSLLTLYIFVPLIHPFFCSYTTEKCKYFRLISLISAGGMLVICTFCIGNSIKVLQ